MKCPKCQYIRFDSGDRCRNCGYDFSLSQDLPANDLSIHNEHEPIGPFADIPLHQQAPDTGSLPLFRRENSDPDAPLVTPSATPRAPLSVRRGAPIPAPRQRPRRAESDPEPRLALDTAEFAVVPETQAPRRPVETPEPPTVAEEAPRQAAASAVARITGGLVDFVILGGIDLTVVYFTLKICDMTFPQLPSLPMAPLLAFLALLNGGYLVTFVAAGGQTIGKMAAGTRVVPADPAAPAAERVSFGQAVVRAAGYVVSILPAGLGFLPALAGRERRAVHDRLSDTRVVRA
ncbi:MAG TPA: RDD family protein [Vicinamibacterales bacterium]|nr:RDD family protein [Vicinamibacterales bacterium]